MKKYKFYSLVVFRPIINVFVNLLGWVAGWIAFLSVCVLVLMAFMLMGYIPAPGSGPPSDTVIAGSYVLSAFVITLVVWFLCNIFHIWLDHKTTMMADDTGAYAGGEYIYINTGEKPPPEKPTLKKEA